MTPSVGRAPGARPRQVAMYLAKQLTTRSLPEIGKKFGGVAITTTVMHAVRKSRSLCSLMRRSRGRRAVAPDAAKLNLSHRTPWRPSQKRCWGRWPFGVSRALGAIDRPPVKESAVARFVRDPDDPSRDGGGGHGGGRVAAPRPRHADARPPRAPARARRGIAHFTRRSWPATTPRCSHYLRGSRRDRQGNRGWRRRGRVRDRARSQGARQAARDSAAGPRPPVTGRGRSEGLSMRYGRGPDPLPPAMSACEDQRMNHSGEDQRITARAGISDEPRRRGLRIARRCRPTGARSCSCTAIRSPRTCGVTRSPRPAESGVARGGARLPGYGDSEPDPPGSWERHMKALDRFVAELELGSLRDRHATTGGVLVGLRWACDHPERGQRAPDLRWRVLLRPPLARSSLNTMRTPRRGRAAVLAGFSARGSTG